MHLWSCSLCADAAGFIYWKKDLLDFGNAKKLKRTNKYRLEQILTFQKIFGNWFDHTDQTVYRYVWLYSTVNIFIVLDGQVSGEDLGTDLILRLTGLITVIFKFVVLQIFTFWNYSHRSWFHSIKRFHFQVLKNMSGFHVPHGQSLKVLCSLHALIILTYYKNTYCTTVLTLQCKNIQN